MKSIPTPTARDWKDTPGSKAITQNKDGSTRDRRDRVAIWVYEKEKDQNNGVCNGTLNPTWVEWLMGWPTGWTDLKPLAMDKFQQWLDSHGRY